MPGKGRQKKQGRSRKGTGSIREVRPGYFFGEIGLGVDGQGKRIRRMATGQSREEVEQKLDEYKKRHRAGQPLENEKITVAEHFTDWLRSKKANVASATHGKYSWLYNKHIEPGIGNVQMRRLDYRRINALWESLDAKGLGRNTVATIAAVLRGGLNDAVQKGLLVQNPMKLAAKRTPSYDEARYLNHEEIAAFFTAARGERLEDFFLLLLHTGLRPGEALGLSWDAVDLEARKLTVRQALHEEDGKLFIGDVKTKAGRRTLKLSPEAVAAIKRHRSRQNQERLKAGKKWSNPDNLVFTGDKGGFLRRSTITKRNVQKKDRKKAFSGPLGRIMNRSGLEDVTLHTFRHTHASILIFQGVDIKTVSRRLGHENITITLQTYGHLMPGQDERAAEAMDDFMAGLGK